MDGFCIAEEAEQKKKMTSGKLKQSMTCHFELQKIGVMHHGPKG
jgi:hypothetical protein